MCPLGFEVLSGEIKEEIPVAQGEAHTCISKGLVNHWELIKRGRSLIEFKTGVALLINRVW